MYNTGNTVTNRPNRWMNRYPNQRPQNQFYQRRFNNPYTNQPNNYRCRRFFPSNNRNYNRNNDMDNNDVTNDHYANTDPFLG